MPKPAANRAAGAHTAAPDVDPPETQNLFDILARPGDGKAIHDIEDELRDLMRAVHRRHHLDDIAKVKGALTIKIEFVAERGAVATTIGVESKRPGQPKRTALHFSDEAGRLFTSDPNQRRFSFGVRSSHDPVTGETD